MADTPNHTVSVAGAWPAERWAAIIVIGALAILILIRAGFRGVDLMGASVRVN